MIRYFLFITLVLTAWGTAFAQAPEPDQAVAPGTDPYDRLDPIAKKVSRMADELRSPFCPGKSISNCTSYQAFELRKTIYDMFKSGMTEPEIVAALEDKHGAEISNPVQPWYTFFVPFLPFLCFGLLIFWVVSRWRRADESSLNETGHDSGSDHQDRLERLRAQVKSHED